MNVEQARQIRAAAAYGRDVLLELDAAAAAAVSLPLPTGDVPPDAPALLSTDHAVGGAGSDAKAAFGEATDGPDEVPQGLEAGSSNGSSWELVEHYPAADVNAGLLDVCRMIAGTLPVLKVLANVNWNFHFA